MQKVQVSERALAQRINRKLAHELRSLRKARGRWADELGYYILDLDRNFVVSQNCDLESLGQELGVLEAWESVAWSD